MTCPPGPRPCSPADLHALMDTVVHAWHYARTRRLGVPRCTEDTGSKWSSSVVHGCGHLRSRRLRSAKAAPNKVICDNVARQSRTLLKRHSCKRCEDKATPATRLSLPRVVSGNLLVSSVWQFPWTRLPIAVCADTKLQLQYKHALSQRARLAQRVAVSELQNIRRVSEVFEVTQGRTAQ